MVVDELPGLRVLAVALGLRTERPHHLRVAGVAPLADVDIPPLQLQRRVRLHAGDRRDVALHDVGRDDLDQAADQDQRRAQGRRTGSVSSRASGDGIPSAPWSIGRKRRGSSSSTEASNVPWRAVLTRLYIITTTPARYSVPPMARIDAERDDLQDGFQEVRVLQRSERRELLPHQGLRQAGGVHGHRVEHDAQRPDPEMEVRQLAGIERRSHTAAAPASTACRT